MEEVNIIKWVEFQDNNMNWNLRNNQIREIFKLVVEVNQIPNIQFKIFSQILESIADIIKRIWDQQKTIPEMWVNKMFLMDYKHKLKANIMLIGKKEINKKNHVLETMFKMLKVELL